MPKYYLSSTSRNFSKVQVVGLYNSGTNWLSSAIRGNFPYHVAIDPKFWKHTFINRMEPWLAKEITETFFFVIVKDVHMWLRSLEFHPYHRTQTTVLIPPGSYSDDVIKTLEPIPFQADGEEVTETSQNLFRGPVILGRN